MDTLPEELIDMIVSYASPGTLYTWLRTASKYSRIAYPYLYKQLIIVPEEHYKTKKLVANRIALLELIDTVKTLQISPCDHTRCREAVHYLIASCPRIQALYIKKTAWNDLLDKMQRPTIPKQNRGFARSIDLPEIPPSQRFLHLKEIEFENFGSLHEIGPIFALPALETLKIYRASIPMRLLLERVDMLRSLKSNVKHLDLSGLWFDFSHRLTWSFLVTDRAADAALLRILQGCSRLETLALTSFDEHPNLIMNAAALVTGLSGLPIRELRLHGLLEGPRHMVGAPTQVPGAPTQMPGALPPLPGALPPPPGAPTQTPKAFRPQPSIIPNLEGGLYEELDLDASLVASLFSGFDPTVLPKVRTLQITPDQGTPIDRVLDMLQGMPAGQVKTSLPALERLVVHNDAREAAELDAVEELAAEYGAVGVALVAEE